MKKFSLLFLLILAACGGSSGPEKAVEDYFRALVDKDATKAVTVSCAAWENGARTDVDTFAMYPAALKDLSCRAAGTEGEFQLVECTGIATLDYNGEITEIDLADRVYMALNEGGEWRMCGYQ
jgi:hypothetical protein